MLLSLLAFMCYVCRGEHVRDLVLSAIAAGLAWLTKTPSLFLIPFVGLILLLNVLEKYWQQKRIMGKDVQRLLFPFLVWGSIGLAVPILLWPAMWVEPIYTLRRMLGAALGYATEGHDTPLYFNGNVYSGDPGFLFYPITYLWRTTPMVLLGLLFSFVGLLRPQQQWLESLQRRSLTILFLYSFLFLLFMDFGAKKFDRYLLPVYPALDIAAGIGWIAAARWIRQHGSRSLARVVSTTLLFAAIVAQAAMTASSYPYYLSYYNPLLGGTHRAPQVMMVGWGEGLDQAARFLNSQPGAGHPQVATGVWPTSFSYFYKGPVLHSRFEAGTDRIDDWRASDFYVLYINEQQRDKVSSELMDYFATIQPVNVVRISGLDYVYIYDIRDLPPPDFMTLSSAN